MTELACQRPNLNILGVWNLGGEIGTTFSDLPCQVLRVHVLPRRRPSEGRRGVKIASQSGRQAQFYSGLCTFVTLHHHTCSGHFKHMFRSTPNAGMDPTVVVGVAVLLLCFVTFYVYTVYRPTLPNAASSYHVCYFQLNTTCVASLRLHNYGIHISIAVQVSQRARLEARQRGKAAR